jgi:Arc/MetJ-type ribon-helix-helix transcriptional regulator
MAISHQLSVTLPEDTLRLIESKVASNELENWLRTEIVARWKAMEADPSRGLTVEEVLASLEHDAKRDPII